MAQLRWKILLGFLMLIISQGAYAQQKKITKDCDRIKVSHKITDETNNQKNGEIKLTIEGGKAPYAVQWIAYNYSEKGAHIKNLKTGFYTAVVSDSELCIKQVDNIQVENTLK
jgi:hypothetical protein